MEKQYRSTTPSCDFEVGVEAIYGIHGRCHISGIESRSVSGNPTRFYRLEVKRSNLSRSRKKEPAIWLPIDTARSQGLRLIMTSHEADEALDLLASREHYFNLSEPWSSLYPKLESTLRKEGGPGLAKVFSFLYVFMKRQVVPGSDVTKLFDQVYKLLFQELSEALETPVRELEERTARGLRQKLLADQ